MPKKTYEITDFSGGLNAISDPKDIEDNQFSQNWNVMVDRQGVLRLAGRGQYYIPASMFSSDNFQEGFGLFQFSVDYAFNEMDSNLNTGIETGTIDAFTSTSSFTLEDTASTSSVNDYYNNMTIFIYSGTGAGESRLITDYTGSSRTIACEAFNTTLHDKADGTPSKYIIHRWKSDGTNWAGSAVKKDFITNGTIPIAAISRYNNDSYYFICKKTSITDEQSVNLGYMEFEPNFTLKAGVEYNLDIKMAFKNTWKNLVCNGHEDGNATNNYGDKPSWIELYSSTVTDGTNTGLSLYANNRWVTTTEQAGYISLVDSNFIDNGDFTAGLADGWVEHDMTGVISSAEEAAGDAYGEHDGTLKLTATADLDMISGRPESYIYQQLSLDDNTPYHLNFVYGSDASGLRYSVVDVTNLIATGVISNLGSTISDTGDGLTTGDSLTCAVDGKHALAAQLLNRNIYKSDGTFVGICTAVGSTTQITFGGGVAVDLANDVELYLEKVIYPWRVASHTGGLTTYKFLNFDTNSNNKPSTDYIIFTLGNNSGGTESNIQIRFAPAAASANVNIAGVTVHKAFNDLVTMSQNNDAQNPFLGSPSSWSNYKTSFTIPSEYADGGTKSDWVFRIHGGKYGNRTSASITENNQEVYLNRPELPSKVGDTITVLNDNTETESIIGLFSEKNQSWDKSTLILPEVASKPVYNYINGMFKVSDANFENNNTNQILYYNDNFALSTNNWYVEKNPINIPPYTQINSVSTNPYLTTKFDACTYLNILHSTDHFIGRETNTTTNWNSDEFGLPDGTGAPYGNGHIVRYANDSNTSIATLNTHSYGRFLANPDSTSAHSTNLGLEKFETVSHEGLTNNDGQNPVVARIVGVDTINTANDMSSSITADYVAKVQYSILWEVSCADRAHGNRSFESCIVPYFKVTAGKGDGTFVVNNTVTVSGTSRTHQEAVTMNVAPYSEITGDDHVKFHGKVAAESGVTISQAEAGTKIWDGVEIVSLAYDVGTNSAHAEMTVLLTGEISFNSTEIEDEEDIVFKIEEMSHSTILAYELIGLNNPNVPPYNCLVYPFESIGDTNTSFIFELGNRNYSVFTRFMIQKLDVVFYNPSFDASTDVPVLSGNGTALNFVWAAPVGSSSSSWSERSFKLGTTSVNYFNEESSIAESSQIIPAVTPGYSPEVFMQISEDRMADRYIKKTKFYLKDNESDIWYLQFYVDHETKKFYSTTSGKSVDIASSAVTGSPDFAQLDREDLKDFNEVNSYESETMVSQEDATSNAKLTARYKTSVLANNRLYVGNIFQDGKQMGDRMIKSPVGKYNLLPASNFIDVAINDGDEITALAFYKDKLLQFKKRKVFVINTSDDYEFLEDTFHDIGIKGQCSVATTPNGVVWANKNGCYLYDGEELTNLIENKIPNSNYYATQAHNEWNPGLSKTNDSKYVVGYIEDRDSILVNFSDKKLTVTNYPLAAIYHFGTKSWTPLFLSLSKQTSGATGNFSNFITDNNGDILYYHYDSTALAYNINEIKKWNHDAIEDSDFSLTTKPFYFTTKDITFDSISSTKNIYTVYITYKVKRDGTDSGVAVVAAVNGSNSFTVDFSAASKFKGTATTCYGSSTLDETDGIWKIAELKLDTPSEGKGINSIQLQMTGATAAFDFEINDISIEYRIVKKS